MALVLDYQTLVDIFLSWICPLPGKICASSTRNDYTDSYLLVKEKFETQP